MGTWCRDRPDTVEASPVGNKDGRNFFLREEPARGMMLLRFNIPMVSDIGSPLDISG